MMPPSSPPARCSHFPLFTGVLLTIPLLMPLGCRQPEASREDYGEIVTELPDLPEAQGEYSYPDIGVNPALLRWQNAQDE